MSEPRLTDLIATAREDVGAIVTDTTALAKAELGDAGKRAGIGAGLVVAALGLVWLMIISLTLAYGFGLTAAGLPLWAAFLIVAGTYLLIAAALALWARHWFTSITGPVRTMAAVKAAIAALTGGKAEDADATGEDPTAAATAADLAGAAASGDTPARGRAESGGGPVPL